MIKDGVDDDLDEEERNKQVAELRESLPQVIYF
jgi:hypothetical protein